MTKGIFTIIFLILILFYSNICSATHDHPRHPPNPERKKMDSGRKLKHTIPTRQKKKSKSFASKLSQINQNTWIIYLFGGFGWERSGTTTSVNLGGLNTNLYEASTINAITHLEGFGIGYQWNVTSHFWTTLALESLYTQMTSEAGLVRPLFFINPDFDTLDFTYQIRSIPLMVISQLGSRWGKVFPYFLVGVGATWNRASHYNETPTNPNSGAAPMQAMFENRTEVYWAYTLGIGFNFHIARIVTMGLEYRYLGLGKADFNPTVLQTTNDRLSLGTIHANALLIRLSVDI